MVELRGVVELTGAMELKGAVELKGAEEVKGAAEVKGAVERMGAGEERTDMGREAAAESCGLEASREERREELSWVEGRAWL